VYRRQRKKPMQGAESGRSALASCVPIRSEDAAAALTILSTAAISVTDQAPDSERTRATRPKQQR